jgi:predicted negative regulator of RcsB-dependent stress response
VVNLCKESKMATQAVKFWHRASPHIAIGLGLGFIGALGWKQYQVIVYSFFIRSILVI